ncbi:MAG: hypothetical protein HOQ22_17980 [Nocardioidaceae bacterium]|nr:hypothetical protein [Nocardioidaceae bacterium]NUS52916.1 hypothetical protein [Nocardioidaceae bacterium]
MTDLAWAPDPDDPEERRFLDVYGAWDPLTPTELAEVMAGFPEPWWVVGGHAVEAFTGVRRFHEDIDLVVFADALPALREQLRGVFHLWSNDGGTFRVIDDRTPEPLHPLAQVWMRENARSPWRVDCPVNPVRDGRWVSKRDDDLVLDLDEATWVADAGVRYLRPELVLHYKARQVRPKDEVDLDHVLPLLDDDRRAWLRAAVRRTYGDDHVWLPRL